jgi:hypothetical protein
MMSPKDIAERRDFNRHERIARYCPACLSEDHVKSPAVLMPFVADRALGWRPVEIDDSWNLRTIANGHAYTVCNSVQCRTCGMLFLDIRFSDYELGRLYSDYRGADYTRLREHYEPGYGARNDQLKDGIPWLDAVESFLRPHLTFPVKLLDWGGDTGKNTPFKSEAGTFHIYDISHAPPVPGASFVDLKDIAKERYDLIVCSNVLEHIPYPIDLIEEVSAYMTNETVLYIEVPLEAFMFHNQRNDDIVKRRKHWHEHVNFFTMKSIEYLCKNSGLDIIESKLFLVEKISDDAHIFQLACRRAAPA